MRMAPTTKQWTLEELHSLPDDGNKYEIIDGELFVTPPPNADHETILARLTRLLEPYVAAQELGFVYHPRAVLRIAGSEVEPDLMVRRPPARKGTDWSDLPLPILIVEVLSPSTRRRDRQHKRDFYLAQGIPEYWIVDPEREAVTVVRPDHDDRTVDDALVWHPASALRSAAGRPATFVVPAWGARSSPEHAVAASVEPATSQVAIARAGTRRRDMRTRRHRFMLPRGRCSPTCTSRGPRVG